MVSIPTTFGVLTLEQAEQIFQIDTSSKKQAEGGDIILQRKRKGFDKKNGVELQMKFRNHRDPLYYDKHANDRIFVPT